MIGPNATWADYRAIYQKSLDNPDRKYENNLLADPKIREFSEGRPDDEIVREAPAPDFDAPAEPDPSEEDPESGLGNNVVFNLVVDGLGKVHLLTRTNREEGTLEYRSNGEWELITEEDEMPILDEYPFTQVDGQAVAIWDSLETTPRQIDFQSTLLDESD
jgi:hypothetical protein